MPLESSPCSLVASLARTSTAILRDPGFEAEYSQAAARHEGGNSCLCSWLLSFASARRCSSHLLRFETLALDSRKGCLESCQGLEASKATGCHLFLAKAYR